LIEFDMEGRGDGKGKGTGFFFLILRSLGAWELGKRGRGYGDGDRGGVTKISG
jgi:hypothetical protein